MDPGDRIQLARPVHDGGTTYPMGGYGRILGNNRRILGRDYLIALEGHDPGKPLKVDVQDIEPADAFEFGAALVNGTES